MFSVLFINFYIFTQSLCQEHNTTQDQFFKWSTTNLNSETSFLSIKLPYQG